MRRARRTALFFTCDTGIEREHALINLRFPNAFELVRRRFSQLTQCATKRRLVKRLDDQEACKDTFILPHSLLDRRYRGSGVVGRTDLHRGNPVERHNRVSEPLGLVRQMLDTQRDYRGSLAPAGPGRYDATTANEVAELRHDALRPWRRRIEPCKVGGSIENLGRLQFIKYKEAIDVGPRGAEYARRQESLRRHAFGGVLAR